MKRTKLDRMFLIIGLFCLLAITSFAANSFWLSKSEDTAIALRARNNGSENVVVNITTNGAGADMSVVIGSVTNTVDGSGDTDTIAELAAAIAACTNSAGVAVLTVDQMCSLAADSTDGELMDTAVTITPGRWGNIALWDTSDVKHYSVYLPDERTGGPDGDRVLKKIMGDPGGTGALTVEVYKDRTEVLQYAYPTNVPSGVAESLSFELNPDIPVGRTGNVLIRASRASTGTTGNVAAGVELK